MVRQVKLELPEYGRLTLTEMRDHHPKPYMRERAAALLKVADGGPLKTIAQDGLLRQRDPDTLGRWVKRYQAQGLAGLYNQPGRGRKPAFFPLSSGGSSRRSARDVKPESTPTRAGSEPVVASWP